MNFLELCKRTRSECGIAGSGPSTVVGQAGDLLRVVNWVQQAYNEVCSKWDDWKYLFTEGFKTLVVDQVAYSIPSDFGAWEEDSFYITDTNLGGTNTYKLVPIDYDVYRRDKTTWDEMPHGMPTNFVILPDDSIKLFPKPDQQYRLDYEYFKAAPALSVNTDAPLIPSRWHEVIVYRAKMFWAGFEESETEYKAAEVIFNSLMRELESHQLPSKDNMHRRAEGVDIVVSPQ